jgi:hypothetical protein
VVRIKVMTETRGTHIRIPSAGFGELVVGVGFPSAIDGAHH